MDSSKFSLRKAGIKDSELVRGLIRRNLKPFFERTGEGWSEAKLSNLDLSRIAMLEFNGVAAGFLDFEFSDKFDGSIYLHNIQILERFRRKGLGKFALGYLINEAQRRNLHCLYGKLFKQSPSVNWCKLNGFRVVGEISEENSYWILKEVKENA